MDAFTAAGLAVYALSYDEPEALRDFRDAFGMTYELMSDPQSDAIRTLGILNTFIDADDHPWYGIPFPGTYLLDAEGTVTAKFFENNLALRASPEQMLRAAGGGPEPNSPTTSRCRGEVDWSLNFNGDRLAFSVLHDLLVCCDIPPGRHLYARPAPAGMVAADVEFDEHPSVWFGEVERPAATRHQLAGTGEAFDVYTGELILRVPIATWSGRENGRTARGDRDRYRALAELRRSRVRCAVHRALRVGDSSGGPGSFGARRAAECAWRTPDERRSALSDHAGASPHLRDKPVVDETLPILHMRGLWMHGSGTQIAAA